MTVALQVLSGDSGPLSRTLLTAASETTAAIDPLPMPSSMVSPQRCCFLPDHCKGSPSSHCPGPPCQEACAGGWGRSLDPRVNRAWQQTDLQQQQHHAQDVAAERGKRNVALAALAEPVEADRKADVLRHAHQPRQRGEDAQDGGGGVGTGAAFLRQLGPGAEPELVLVQRGHEGHCPFGQVDVPEADPNGDDCLGNRLEPPPHAALENADGQARTCGDEYGPKSMR